MAKDSGKVSVVTGALGSIGLPICAELARRGDTVVMVVRDEAKSKAARDALSRATDNPRLELVACDLGSLASVRQAAAQVAKAHPAIHVLVNNAAFFSASRHTTRDGFEMQFGVNHLAHFLFTRLLEAPLKAGRARVVAVSMPSKTPLAFDDLMLQKKYDGMTAYGMSKAANLYFVRELAERWKGQVSANAVYPGFVKTTLISEAPLPIRIVFALVAASPEKGALGPVHVASAPELDGVTGSFFAKTRLASFPPGSEDAALRRRLWEESERLVATA
jgi:NAD(P)-dependent dehydrogenase (short-subunit alcohol dehydrogenase family)